MSDNNMAHIESSLGSTRVGYKRQTRVATETRCYYSVERVSYRSLKLWASACEPLITVLTMLLGPPPTVF